MTRRVEPAPPFVLATGACDAEANLKSAIWAFDILKYTMPSLQLVILGDGPERPTLERFAWQLGFDDFRVRFVGWNGQLMALLQQASVLWLVQQSGGQELVHAARQMHVPVVGMANSEFTPLLANDWLELVPMADHVALAAATFKLLKVQRAAYIT